MCDLVVNDRSPLFASVCNPNRAVSKYTFGRVLKCLSCELFDTNDVRGLTCHSMRNFGYVLSYWGDGNVEDAIFDADHSPCSKSYQLYILTWFLFCLMNRYIICLYVCFYT